MKVKTSTYLVPLQGDTRYVQPGFALFSGEVAVMFACSERNEVTGNVEV